MGKSPGKWIKTVLFGKKHSKPSLSENATLDRKASAKPPVEDLADPVISNPCQFTDTGAGNMEFDEGKSGTPVGTIDSVPVDQGLESRSNFVSVPVSDDEMRRQCQAATKAQAVFRGFLARRAFMALKGIIRLQALIRGHLVRRQAVATLRCMKAIVKFQALARGRRVRLSHTMPEMRKKYILEFCQVDPGAHVSFGLEKLATNAYVHKLLLSLPNVMSLSLQYDVAEPNSASNWLERWSLSRFWEPPGRPKKVLSSKPRRKQGGPHLVENEAGKSKRIIRKASSSATRVSGTSASSEIDKPKRKPGKVISHQTESVQEQDQNEFEKVKRNLRKVSASVIISSEKLEMEPQKPQQSLNTALNSEKEIAISVEKPTDSDLLVDKIAPVEAPSKTEVRADQVDPPHDDRPLIENLSTENGEKMESAPFSHDEVGPKEEEDGKENEKIRKRRSLTTKQEYPENVSLNTPSLPSYMAATQSAKAKLKLQGSSKFSEDGEEVGYVRRHSLPASINGKLSSLSPRIQKPVQANGKGVSKTNRSITSSRDGTSVGTKWGKKKGKRTRKKCTSAEVKENMRSTGGKVCRN